MSISSVVNDLVTSVSVINAQKPIPPTISGYSVGGVDDTALDPAGGQTVQINGTGFLVGATITFDGSAVAVVTYVNPNQLTFTSPAKSAGTYTIYVVNSDGGTAIYIPGIIYSVLPTWTTSAGTLGSYYETTSISNTVIATGDAPITYSLFSGSLPAGSTLYANGVITGTAPVDSSSTTYSFTIQATDAQLQDSTRSFSLTINVDAVTWVSPANNTTYTNAVDSAIANVALSATDAAGYSVSYSANALPTGLSLSGANISGTPTVIADSSTLLTATAATTNRSATRTINWSITVANDIYFEYNTLLIPGASTTFVDDASTNNFAVTINGDTKPNSFNPYTPGYYSNYFDGSGDYLTFPTTSGKLDYTGDFTTEMWIYWVSMPTTGYDDIYGNNSVNGSYILGTSNSSTVWAAPYILRLYIAGYGDVINGNTVLTASQWYHIAHTRSSGVNRLFVNGVLQTNTYTDSTSRSFGSSGVNLANNSNAYVSNFRFLQGTALYTTTFTPPSAPLTAIANTSLLTCQSNRFIDNSTNAYTITKAGDVAIKSFSPFTPNSSYSTYGSGYFDGTGDYLTVPSSTAFAFASGVDFTAEGWVYLTSYSPGSVGGAALIGTVGGAYTGWSINLGQDINSLRITSNASGTWADNITVTTGNGVPLNTWTHLAFVRNGGSLVLYKNGVSVASMSGASAYNFTSPNNSAYIGYFADATLTRYVNGNISDVRVVKGTAVYTTAFTPPSAPLTAIANTSLLTLQTNQPANNNIFLDNSTNNFLVTRNGNTTQGTFSPYGGNWSNYFGGQMASALSPSSTKFNLTGDFTLEAYVFLTALPGGDWGILDARVSGASASPWLFGISGAGKIYYYDGSVRVGATTLTTNSWYHLAWVRSGSVLRGYVNGVLDYYNGAYGSGAVSPGSTAPVVGTKDYTIGAYGTTGYISNLRIVNGTAVYTTSSTTVGATIFTPSTTPLTAVTNTVVLTCQSQRFVDNSLNNFTVTPSSTTISVQRFSPFNPSSLTATSYSGYFDGNADYLSVPSSSAAALGTTYTIECYIYRTGTASSGSYTSVMQLINTQPYGSSVTGFMLTFDGGNVFNFRDSSSAVIVSTADTNLPLNTWIHVAIVRNGSGSNNVTMYLNGVSIVTGTSSGTQATNQAMYIGGDSNGNCSFPGYISNLRIVKGVAVYTGAFTVPTTPLQATQSSGTNIAAITGTATSLLTCQSTAFIDNSTNNFTITATGNSQPTIQNPFGYTSATTNGYTVGTIGGSGYFDGTGDYLTVSTLTPATSLANGNWTIECWFYASATKTWAQIMGNRSSASGSTGYVPIAVSYESAIIKLYSSSNGSSWNLVNAGTIGTVSLQTWNHVAIVRNGNNLEGYLNGTKVTLSTGLSGISFTATNLFYASGVDPFAGYVSDMRLVTGTAVYTSNFVPSSAPLTAIQNTVLLTNMTGAGIYDAAMMTTMETVADAKLSTAVSKFGGSSMYFDGTGDYLLISSTQFQNFAFGTGDFTIEMWAYPTSGTNNGLFQISSTAGGFVTTGLNIAVASAASTNIQVNLNSTAYTTTTGGIFPLNTWTHIALVRSSGVSKLYVNGTLNTTIGTAGAITDASNYTGTYLVVGGYYTTGYVWIGYIDDLRITKGYARYTTTFTPPTTAFPIY